MAESHVITMKKAGQTMPEDMPIEPPIDHVAEIVERYDRTTGNRIASSQ